MSHDNRYVKGSNAGYNLGLTFDFSFCIFYAVSNIVFRFEFEKTFALYFSTGLISGFFFVDHLLERRVFSFFITKLTVVSLLATFIAMLSYLKQGFLGSSHPKRIVRGIYLNMTFVSIALTRSVADRTLFFCMRKKENKVRLLVDRLSENTLRLLPMTVFLLLGP